MGTPIVIRFKERQDSRIEKKDSDEEAQESYGNRTKKKEEKKK